MSSIDDHATLTLDKLVLRLVDVQFARTACTRSGRFEEQHAAIRLCRKPARKHQPA